MLLPNNNIIKHSYKVANICSNLELDLRVLKVGGEEEEEFLPPKPPCLDCKLEDVMIMLSVED